MLVSILLARVEATMTTGLQGAMFVREWKGKLERVTVLEKGFAWNGKSYASLSQIAKAMTGTSWNGHRFFGLRKAESDRAAQAGPWGALVRIKRLKSRR